MIGAHTSRHQIEIPHAENCAMCAMQKLVKLVWTEYSILSQNHNAWEEPWHGGEIKRARTSMVSA
jgi:hypothetical protein